MTRPSKREIETELDDLTAEADGGRPDLSDGWDYIDETPDREPDYTEDGFGFYHPDGGDI